MHAFLKCVLLIIAYLKSNLGTQLGLNGLERKGMYAALQSALWLENEVTWKGLNRVLT